MQAEYEIFEVLPDGSSSKRAVVIGLEIAQVVLKELAKGTHNECYAAHAVSHQIVAQTNLSPTRRRVFQIAYDPALEPARIGLLKHLNYQIASVLGNEKAKIVLSSIEPYNLFIVGHSAPPETRTEMVCWLKENYPGVKILALNPSQEIIPGADYNVRYSEPENWLRIATQVMQASSVVPSKRSATRK